MKKPVQKFVLHGTILMYKKVSQHTVPIGRVYLPKEWIGKKIALVLME